MSDPKQQQEPEDEELTADLTVPDTQAEQVGGGGENISLEYKKVAVTYHPQQP